MTWIIFLLTGARDLVSKAWAWLTANPMRLLAAVIALLVAVIVWQHVGIVSRDARIAELGTDNRLWAKAFAVQHKSFLVLEGALKVQNAAVERIKAEADTRTAAGQEALRAAMARSGDREALARRIEAQRPAGGDCRTSAAAMAAKGEL